MFQFDESLSYLMPAHFGGSPLGSYTYADVTTVAVEYRTDPAALSRYVPGCFEVTEPLVQIGYAINRGVEWMAGGGYNLVAVQTPVRYRHAGQTRTGAYALVVWENKAAPILGGREQTGIPKIFADIAELHQIDDRLFGNVSYEGSTFLRLDVRRTAAFSETELSEFNARAGHLDWFGWRHIPNVGRPGAALNHPTLYPIDNTYREAWHAEGLVDWQALTWEQNPAQAHIIDALSRLPVEEYSGCVVTVGSQIIRVDQAQELAW